MKPVPLLIVDPDAEALRESHLRSLGTADRSKQIFRVEALYDFALPAVTVVFWWWPVAWLAKTKRRDQQTLLLREHAFSLITKTRLSGFPGNCWWRTIRCWIADEAARQDFGFVRRCAWRQVNAPGTLRHATKRPFTTAELVAMERGTYRPEPFFGFLDLRETSKKVQPKWGTETTDITPSKFRGDGPCETCGRLIADHPPGDRCPGFVAFIARKAEWRAWYTKTMGQAPKEDGRYPGVPLTAIASAHILPDTV